MWIRIASNFKNVVLGPVISASRQPRLDRHEPHATIGCPCVRDQDTIPQYKQKSQERQQPPDQSLNRRSLVIRMAAFDVLYYYGLMELPRSHCLGEVANCLRITS